MRIVFGAANQLHGTVGAQSVLESAIRSAASDLFATTVLNECVSNSNRLPEYGNVVDKDALERAFRDRMTEKYGPGAKVLPQGC